MYRNEESKKPSCKQATPTIYPNADALYTGSLELGVKRVRHRDGRVDAFPFLYCVAGSGSELSTPLSGIPVHGLLIINIAAAHRGDIADPVVVVESELAA